MGKGSKLQNDLQENGCQTSVSFVNKAFLSGSDIRLQYPDKINWVIGQFLFCVKSQFGWFDGRNGVRMESMLKMPHKMIVPVVLAA